MNKGLEALTIIQLANGNFIYTKEYETIKKELTALEIIKNKQVNCYDIINSVNYEHYLVLMKDYDKSWLLTNKEYNLLKEVLL